MLTRLRVEPLRVKSKNSNPRRPQTRDRPKLIPHPAFGRILRVMDLTFNPRAYAHVPLLYWPWIWWQLFWLRGWSEAARREVLFEIDARGKVHVILISDGKDDLRAWMAAQRAIYRDHWTPMHDASGEAHLCALHYWMGRLMECGRRVHFKTERTGEYPAPIIDDSG